MTENGSGVLYRREGRVAFITLNRPDKLNAFTDDQVRALKARLVEFDQDDEAWVAILHGAGRAFSSGADVHQRQLRGRDELKKLGGPSGPGAYHHPIMYEGFVNWKPVIAAVHGYAIGMALGLALRCELVVATMDAQFRATEIRRGLYGGNYWSVLQFRGAGTFADEIFMTGRGFSGVEAERRGVITTAVEADTHLEAARELADQVLENPPLAVRAIVRARRWRLQQHERPDMLFNEASKLHLTDDFRESALAFAENRPTREFTGH